MQPTIYMEKRGGDVESDGDASLYDGLGTDSTPPVALRDARLEYVKGASNVYIRGPVTGRPYSFVQGSGGTVVDALDVEALTVTGLFRQMGIRTGA